MSKRVCDLRACESLERTLPFVSLEMQGEEDCDQRVVADFVRQEEGRCRRVTLLYCPFCGMRLVGAVVAAISEFKRG